MSYGTSQECEDAVACEEQITLTRDGKEYAVTASPCDVDALKKGFEYRAGNEETEPVQYPSANDILKAMKSLLAVSDSYKMTGNIHCSALCKGAKIIYCGEDIGRSNSVYKAIGKSLLNEENPSSFYLCTTGRIHKNTMDIAIASGIGCVVSRSAVTDLAIDMAVDNNIRLYGFARENKLNEYN